MNFILGALLSSIISLYAYNKKSLSKSGVFAAIILGGSLYFLGGLYFFIMMISFFISSSILSKYKKKFKQKIEYMNQKTDKRDYTQVIANSLPALIYAILYFYTNMNIFILGFATTFSATNSDTWASEIGVLSKKKPLSILKFKKLETGMSGGVTLLGTIASFAGSLFLSIIFIIGYFIRFNSKTNLQEVLVLFFLTLLGGFLGSIIDSILGDSIQGIYYNEKKKILTEKKHDDNKKNKLIKGYNFIDNNLVNLLSVSFSSIIIILIYIIIK